MGSWGGAGSLRVDVRYTRNLRYYYVECEIRPNIKRLRKKGVKRKTCRRRTDYNLIVTASEFVKRDWRQLHGYFDKVYSYDETADEIIDQVDLRTLGRIQDLILDYAMPFFRSQRYKEFSRFFWKRKNLFIGYLRSWFACFRCCLGLDYVKWHCRYDFCIRTKLYRVAYQQPKQNQKQGKYARAACT